MQAHWGLGRIVEFRNLYLRWANAHTSQDSQAAWQIRKELARLATAVQRDFDRAGMGYIVLIDPPALGGRQQDVEFTFLAQDPQVTTRHNISQQDMVLHFERAVGEYLRLRRRALWNLFNPFWWIREILAGIVSIPFYVIGLAGFDQKAIESSPGGRFFKLLEGLAIIGGTVTAIVRLLLERD